MASNVMTGAGKPGGLGRGNQDANTVGNDKLMVPTGTSDARDPVNSNRYVDSNAPIEAIRLVPPVRQSKGLHDRSKMGG